MTWGHTAGGSGRITDCSCCAGACGGRLLGSCSLLCWVCTGAAWLCLLLAWCKGIAAYSARRIWAGSLQGMCAQWLSGCLHGAPVACSTDACLKIAASKTDSLVGYIALQHAGPSTHMVCSLKAQSGLQAAMPMLLIPVLTQEEP